MENSTRQKGDNSTEEVVVASPVKRKELVEIGTKVKKIIFNGTLEKVSFVLDGSLETGSTVILQMPFSGRISDNLTGLFFTSYMRSDGQSRFVALTDVQPGSARELFPCFDEPRFKAPLSLTVLHPKGTVARANEMESSDAQMTYDPLWLRTSFDVTRSLPTSLTGLTLTDFEKAERTTDTGTKIRVYSRPEAINSTEFALETSEKVFEFFQSYLAVPPRCTKLDLFALPHLEKTAMSGDGLILVREDGLLYES
ncbi:peptidase family M1, partial [Cooperia oncophora]